MHLVIDYGKLSAGRKKLYVIPLPTGNTSIIVNYGSGLLVSCVMPPAERTIYISNGLLYEDDEGYASEKEAINDAYHPMKIKCPSLIYSIGYSDRPTYGFVRRLVRDHFIYCFNDEVKTHIEAAPYILSNVYHSGVICFGSLNKPESPKHGFTQFWSSPFNGELLGEADSDYAYDDADEFIKNYHEEVLAEAPWEDFTETLCGRKFWASPQGSDGVLVTDRKELLEKIPKKYWRRDEQGIPFLIARAHHQEGSWRFVSGDFAFNVAENSVRCVERVNRKASAAKTKYNSLESEATATT